MPDLDMLSVFAEFGVTGLLIGVMVLMIYLNDRKDKARMDREERINKEHREDMKKHTEGLVNLSKTQLDEAKRSRETLDTIVSLVDHLRPNR